MNTMLTYKYRLYTSEPVKKRRHGKMYVKHDAFLDSRIDNAAEIWNHCMPAIAGTTNCTARTSRRTG